MKGIVNSGEVSFEPRARLLKLLGGELIKDDTMAVVELVKLVQFPQIPMVDGMVDMVEMVCKIFTELV